MSSVIARWKEQLDARVAPYLPVALKQSAALQVILYLDTDGQVGEIKITVKPPLESKAKA